MTADAAGSAPSGRTNNSYSLAYRHPYGTLDGYSIVNGHECAETVTDQNPAGGWTNPGNGQENGDECAWVSSGQGAFANAATGTGSFAMQSTWSNDTNECDISHPVVTG